MIEKTKEIKFTQEKNIIADIDEKSQKQKLTLSVPEEIEFIMCVK